MILTSEQDVSKVYLNQRNMEIIDPFVLNYMTSDWDNERSLVFVNARSQLHHKQILWLLANV